MGKKEEEEEKDGTWESTETLTLVLKDWSIYLMCLVWKR